MSYGSFIDDDDSTDLYDDPYGLDAAKRRKNIYDEPPPGILTEADTGRKNP